MHYVQLAREALAQRDVMLPDPERDASLPVTHDDAEALARMKYNESNLARCYLALREALAQREAHVPVAYERLLNAADALYHASEEYEFDDGLGRGAPQEFWDELGTALESAKPLPARVLEVMREIIENDGWDERAREALAQREVQEPVAYMYELAGAIDVDGNPCQFRRHLHTCKPSVPDNAIRNLQPLYASPPPAQEPVGTGSFVSTDTLYSMLRSMKGMSQDQPGWLLAEGWNKAIRQAIDYSQPIAPPPAQEPDRREMLQEMLEGMSVSVDVSTGEDDTCNRLFGTVGEVMDHPDGKHGVILLVQDAEPNFDAPPPAQVPCLPPQSPCSMTEAEMRIFKLGWLECEAAHRALLAKQEGK